MRVLSGLLCASVLLGRAATAQACGASPEPYYVATQEGPSGAGVARNAPLFVELAVREGGLAEPHLAPLLTLSIQGSDEALAVRSVGTAPHLAWVPEEPLAPNTTYEAHFNPGYEGHPDAIWRFTTGEELTPPVALDGELRVTFESGTDPIVECHNNCGTDCVQTGTLAVTKARVRLPRALHGFGKYRGTVWLTDGAPGQFSDDASREHVVSLQTSVGYDEQGEPTEDAVFTVPEEEASYRPCFAFRVVDARDDRAVSTPFCAEKTFPFEPAAAPAEELRTATSCSFRAAHGEGSSSALVVAIALVSRRRRGAPISG